MVANLFSELIAQDELVILQNFTSVCWPSAGVNTIDLTGGWDTYSGYQVKVVEDQQVTIDGTVLTDRTFTCDNAGWYLIPVLNDCGASVEALFGEVLNDVIVVKEVAGTRVYWPGYVQTLTFLEPGRSYIAKFSDAVSFTYPECMDARAPASIAIPMNRKPSLVFPTLSSFPAVSRARITTALMARRIPTP